MSSRGVALFWSLSRRLLHAANHSPMSSATIKRKWRKEISSTVSALNTTPPPDAAAIDSILERAEGRGLWYIREVEEHAALHKIRTLNRRYGSLSR